MKEKNIFEGAKFGDKFVTRDGRKAILISIYGKEFSHPANLHIEGEADSREYKIDGTQPTNPQTGFHFLEENGADIVSRYQEPINEDELNALAEDFYLKVEQKALENKRIDDWGDAYIFSYNVTDAYKAGYRKAIDR